ncbi:nucleotidyl transferase AbiEii/AbiGii toxin family protein [bacterium]|nr:nucleotidyl transferase AbiEii/AbiGii toxin family protein [bacterium]
MKNSPFFKQAKLMMSIMPLVMSEKCFALKGGSAINLFVRNLPRLSVDIDLTYLPIESRDITLKNIREALARVENKIKREISGVEVNCTTKLFVKYSNLLVKIEPNNVIRGSVFPCIDLSLSEGAEELFEMAFTAKTLSFADLYGGKICAALDRQHPRDFFDIKNLLENEGVTEEVRKAFVIYLASHNRPMNELINPNWIDFREIFERDFVGMTTLPVSYEDLVVARDNLIVQLKSSLTNNEKEFLLSIKKGQPDWNLMNIEGIDKLPAIQWKLLNIKKMPAKKHRESVKKLEKALSY